LGEFLKRLAVAKECGHRNQKIIEKGRRLFGTVAHDLMVVRQILGSDDLHAARNAA